MCVPLQSYEYSTYFIYQGKINEVSNAIHKQLINNACSKKKGNFTTSLESCVHFNILKLLKSTALRMLMHNAIIVSFSVVQ